jgi:hypothetical protein
LRARSGCERRVGRDRARSDLAGQARLVKMSRSAKIFPVSEHQHAPSRFDVHLRPHTSPFDAQNGSLERRHHGRRPGGRNTKRDTWKMCQSGRKRP